MQLDSFFTIGKSHKVCEDYALTNPQCYNLFAISDGCSSSKNTDFGSRILLKSLESGLTHFPQAPIPEMVWSKSLNILAALDMDITCLDATIIAAHMKPDGMINLQWFGDGCIVYHYKNGWFDIVDIEYDKNAPYYLSYFFNAQHKETFKNLKQIKTMKRICCDDKGAITNTIEVPSLDEYQEYTLDPKGYQSISLFSDGVKTLMSNDPTKPKIPLNQVIKELTTFPITNGEFVKRRCLTFLKKYKDYYFHDDFSMATCYMDENKP